MTTEEMLLCPMRAGEGICEPLKKAWPDSLAICCQPGYALISDAICNALHAAHAAGRESVLAKIQGPVAPKIGGVTYLNGSPYREIRCGACDGKIDLGSEKCPACGKAINWEQDQSPALIMTPEEAFNCELCWFEHRELPYSEYAQCELKEGSVVVRIQMFRECYYGHVKEYGSYWRCWTRKPTEEERKGGIWNGHNEEAGTIPSEPVD